MHEHGARGRGELRSGEGVQGAQEPPPGERGLGAWKRGNRIWEERAWRSEKRAQRAWRAGPREEGLRLRRGSAGPRGGGGGDREGARRLLLERVCGTGGQSWGGGGPGNEIPRARPSHPFPRPCPARPYLPGSPCACTRRLQAHRARRQRRRREPERKERQRVSGRGGEGGGGPGAGARRGH